MDRNGTIWRTDLTTNLLNRVGIAPRDAMVFLTGDAIPFVFAMHMVLLSRDIGHRKPKIGSGRSCP